jgi:hypothetical protein
MSNPSHRRLFESGGDPSAQLLFGLNMLAVPAFPLFDQGWLPSGLGFGDKRHDSQAGLERPSNTFAREWFDVTGGIANQEDALGG